MARHFRELDVYRAAMDLAVRVFEFSKALPLEERFGLADQVRRSSRSVCANLAEAFRKRRYCAAFAAKLGDAEAKAAEIQVHLEIAFRNGYLEPEDFAMLDQAYETVIAQLVTMIDQAPRWTLKSQQTKGTTI